MPEATLSSKNEIVLPREAREDPDSQIKCALVFRSGALVRRLMLPKPEWLANSTCGLAFMPSGSATISRVSQTLSAAIVTRSAPSIRSALHKPGPVLAEHGWHPHLFVPVDGDKRAEQQILLHLIHKDRREPLQRLVDPAADLPQRANRRYPVFRREVAEHRVQPGTCSLRIYPGVVAKRFLQVHLRCQHPANC